MENTNRLKELSSLTISDLKGASDRIVFNKRDNSYRIVKAETFGQKIKFYARYLIPRYRKRLYADEQRYVQEFYDISRQVQQELAPRLDKYQHTVSAQGEVSRSLTTHIQELSQMLRPEFVKAANRSVEQIGNSRLGDTTITGVIFDNSATASVENIWKYGLGAPNLVKARQSFEIAFKAQFSGAVTRLGSSGNDDEYAQALVAVLQLQEAVRGDQELTCYCEDKIDVNALVSDPLVKVAHNYFDSAASLRETEQAKELFQMTEARLQLAVAQAETKLGANSPVAERLAGLQRLVASKKSHFDQHLTERQEKVMAQAAVVHKAIELTRQELVELRKNYLEQYPVAGQAAALIDRAVEELEQDGEEKHRVAITALIESKQDNSTVQQYLDDAWEFVREFTTDDFPTLDVFYERVAIKSAQNPAQAQIYKNLFITLPLLFAVRDKLENVTSEELQRYERAQAFLKAHDPEGIAPSTLEELETLQVQARPINATEERIDKLEGVLRGLEGEERVSQVVAAGVASLRV